MIQCENICLKYGKKQILSNVDFLAKAGEITVLLGKNGSGKSSLLKCIAGVAGRFNGRVQLNGLSTDALSMRQRSRLLAMMPQVLTRPSVTVEELLAMARSPYLSYGGKMTTLDWECVDKAMRQTGVEKYRKNRVSTLSGGERQLVFFTMLLVQDAPVPLLDEPSASLDVDYRYIVNTLVREMRRQNRTIVLVMHDLEEAMELADCVYVLRDGAVYFSGSRTAFLESHVHRDVFGLRPVHVEMNGEESFTIFRRCTDRDNHS